MPAPPVTEAQNSQSGRVFPRQQGTVGHGQTAVEHVSLETLDRITSFIKLAKLRAEKGMLRRPHLIDPSSATRGVSRLCWSSQECCSWWVNRCMIGCKAAADDIHGRFNIHPDVHGK